MGTKVQSKMHLPGYYSLRDLNSNNGNTGWPLHHENRNLGPYYDLFLTRQAIDLGYDKEQLRQTILKHESIFRHQLHELHRLYRIQRDMMNEIKNKELNKHLVTVGTSQSSPFSSCLLSEDEEKRHVWESRMLDLNCGRVSESRADSIQSQFSSLKEKFLQSGCGSSQKGLGWTNGESSENGYKKVQRRLFDLERPAEEYINNEEEERGVSAVSVAESYSIKRSYDVPLERNGNLSINNGSHYCSNGGAINSSLYLRRTSGFADLNEPIPIDEASASAFACTPGNAICPKEEVERQDLSSRSYLGSEAAKFSQDLHKGSEEGVRLNNQHLENGRSQKQWSSYNFENGYAGSSGSFCVSFSSEDLYKQHKSIELGNTKTQPAKTQMGVKRKIFGVEIPEKNNGTSAAASHSLDQLPIVPQHDTINSETSISAWKNFSSSRSQNISGNPGSSTFSQGISGSTKLMQSDGISGSKLLVDSISRSVPILTEVSHQNGLYFGFPSGSKESQLWSQSVGFCNRNGTNNNNFASEQLAQHAAKRNCKGLGFNMESKSAVDLTVDALPVSSNQNGSISQSTLIINGERKQENPHGGMSWLGALPPYNGKPTTEVESPQMKLDSLKNYSQQVLDKAEVKKEPSQSIIQGSLSASYVKDAEYQKAEADYRSSNKKILGFSIFENVSKDLPSPSSPLKWNSCASVAGIKVGLSSPDLAPDNLPPKSEERSQVKGFIIEEEQVNQNAGLRHQIDLNVCLAEDGVGEDAQSALSPSSSTTNMKITAKIDLEVPVLDLEEPVTIETETKSTSGLESPEGNLKESSGSLQDEAKENQGFLSVSAAEALVAISASSMKDFENNYCPKSESPETDSLCWFAEIISSYRSDSENDVDVGSAAAGNDGICYENSIPDGMDYFEYMTINLPDTEVEEYRYEPQGIENQKTENPLLRRPRRGQARRGRQRKDFQRDVLPNLTSLSRNEVADDLLTIEGLIRATGGNWQSSLTQKNNAKGSTGRGRKRSGACVNVPPTTTASCSYQVQQPKVGLEERSLTGWGKRTRRPPRQRCPINNLSLPVK